MKQVCTGPHLDNVVLAFLAVLASCFDCILRLELMQLLIVHDLRTDEAPLKVCMDGACCLQ